MTCASRERPCGAIGPSWIASRTPCQADTDCGGENCRNIIWGTHADDNIVWGTASADDNIVWGTSADDNIVWGTAAAERVLWGPGGVFDLRLPYGGFRFGRWR